MNSRAWLVATACAVALLVLGGQMWPPMTLADAPVEPSDAKAMKQPVVQRDTSNGASKGQHAVAPHCSRHTTINSAINDRRSDGTACCKAIPRDQDKGINLQWHMSRLFCEGNDARNGRPYRVVQVGANAGDNANDHLVKFLKSNKHAQGVLLEPVPWLFGMLTNTYKDHRDRIQLEQMAMSDSDGEVKFTAPKQSARGWVPQMGGLKLPPKSLKKMRKTHQMHLFEEISVNSTTFRSLLRRHGWDTDGVDVVVVDAEGFDNVIIDFVLAAMSTEPKIPRIPILQYEWKHLDEAIQDKMVKSLEAAGYCCSKVHYDMIAYAPVGGVGEDVCSVGYRIRQQ